MAKNWIKKAGEKASAKRAEKAAAEPPKADKDIKFGSREHRRTTLYDWKKD